MTESGELDDVGKAPRHIERVREALRSVAGSEILDAGQAVIAGMRLTTGWGEPESGERFGRGWSRFNEAQTTLRSAAPNETWAGAGAAAYTNQNRAQADRAGVLAVLDRSVHRALAREAYQVNYHRGKLDDQSNYLADFSYVSMGLALLPGYGKALKAAAEIAAVKAALGICSFELYEMSKEAGQNAAEIRQAIEGYAGVAPTAIPADPAIAAPPPPPPPHAPPPQQAPSPPPQAPPFEPCPTQPAGTGPAETPAPSTPPIAVAPTRPAPPRADDSPAPGAAAADPGPVLGPLSAVVGALGSLLSGAVASPGAPPVGGQPAPTPATPPDRRKEKKRRHIPDTDTEVDETQAQPGDDRHGRAPTGVDPDQPSSPPTPSN